MLVCSVLGVTAARFLPDEVSGLFSAAKKAKPDRTVVATVNGEKIYQYEIDFIKASQTLSRKNAEEAGEDGSVITVQSEKEILETLIRDKAVLQEAVKQKQTAALSAAEDEIRKNYDAVMKTNGKNAEFLREYMKAQGLTEKEYLQMAAEAYRDVLTCQNYYEAFAQKNQESPEEQYEKHVKQLLDQAEISYK